MSHCAWIFPFPSRGHQWKMLKQPLGPTGPEEPPLGSAGWRRRLPRVPSSPDSSDSRLRPVTALPGHTWGEEPPQEAAKASSLDPRSSWPHQLLQAFPGTLSNNLPPPQLHLNPVLDGAGSILSRSKSSLTHMGHQLSTGAPARGSPSLNPSHGASDLPHEQSSTARLWVFWGTSFADPAHSFPLHESVVQSANTSIVA